MPQKQELGSWSKYKQTGFFRRNCDHFFQRNCQNPHIKVEEHLSKICILSNKLCLSNSLYFASALVTQLMDKEILRLAQTRN